MPGLPNLAKLDYVDRVNRAVDYVTRNLDQPLRLEDVARAACFSSYQRPSLRLGMEHFELRARLPIVAASVPL